MRTRASPQPSEELLARNQRWARRSRANGAGGGTSRAPEGGLLGRAKQAGRLLDSPASLGYALFIDRQLRAAGVDAVAQSPNRQVGEVLAQLIESQTQLFDIGRHGRSVAHYGDAVPASVPPPVEWVSFVDSQNTTWLFDTTFLTSGWSCTFGSTCPGTEPGDNGARGCCADGAYLVDEDEADQVAAAAKRLTAEQWHNFDRFKRGATSSTPPTMATR